MHRVARTSLLRQRQLFDVLASSIGPDSAKLEFSWIRNSASAQTSAIDLETMVVRRAMGEPLQYILGTQPFGPLDIRIRPPVLIPRPETEYWTLKLSEIVSPTLQSPISVLDLCTGSGCIPLLLCHLWPKGSVHAYGADISPDAIKLAEENANIFQIPIGSGKLGQHNRFIPFLADIRDPAFIDTLDPPFDLVTSNPPYISKKQYESLPPSVKYYEDPRALLGDPEDTEARNGLTFYHAIAQLLSNNGLLKADGLVVLEVGEGQANAVEEIMQQEGGMRETEIWKDCWGKDRTVVARKRSSIMPVLCGHSHHP